MNGVSCESAYSLGGIRDMISAIYRFLFWKKVGCEYKITYCLAENVASEIFEIAISVPVLEVGWRCEYQSFTV